MKCSAVVPLEWALVPTECFMKCSAVVPWGCFMKFSAVVPWEWALVPHRVFHEVLLVVKTMSAVTSCQASKEQEYKP